MPCGDFHVDYASDERLFPTLWLKCWMVALILLVFLFPIFATERVISFFTIAGIFVIGAHGLNILTGFTGQISIGHGAFMAIGAYTSGILITKLGLPFILSLPLAGISSSIIGLLFGIPSLRVRGLYLALATLAGQFIIEFAILDLKSLTGGASGIFVPRPSIFGLKLDSELSYFYLVAVVVILATLFNVSLLRAKTGRTFIAVRDRYLSSELIGVNLFKYRLLSFGISSFYVGVAGALWASYINAIGIEQFTLTISVQYLAVIIIGGLGSVKGVFFGVFFIFGINEILSVYAAKLSTILPQLADKTLGIQNIVFGMVIIGFLIFEPEGLNEMWRRLRDY